MKKFTGAALAVSLGLLVMASPSSPWEKGTHLYIADILKKRGGFMNPNNLNEMYGSMAPDIFNYAFSLPADVYDYLYDQTHHDFMKIRQAVKWGFEKPLAFGFISHNDSWGADYTAHWMARTTGLPEGYVITKARMLAGVIDWASLEAVIGSPLPDTVKAEVCHNLIEAAGDIILKRSYPQLGRNLVAAGSRPARVFRNLFLKAYFPGLASMVGPDMARYIILESESAFRNQQVIGYGRILQQDEAKVVDDIAAQFNGLMAGYFESKGITLPPDTDLTETIKNALLGGIAVCENDYMIEVNATVAYVRSQIKKHKLW